jgi:hypothetical protein
VHVGLGDNFEQRGAGAVEIDEAVVLTGGVATFAGVSFEMGTGKS